MNSIASHTWIQHNPFALIQDGRLTLQAKDNDFQFLHHIANKVLDEM